MKIKSYLLSFAKAKGSIAAVALAAVLMAANATVASAQNKATESNGTGNTIEGVDKLYGIDPSETYCTKNHTNETDGNKIVCLYNVGAKKFLSVGGMWGTHASLDVTPYSIYMFWNVNSKTFCLESKIKGSVTNPYMGIDTKHNQVFMDQKANERCIIRFDKAKDYSETNKVYLVRIGYNTKLGYLTAYPNNESKLCDYQKDIAQEGTQEYKNQEWKVITKNEYYLLFNTNPAYMKCLSMPLSLLHVRNSEQMMRTLQNGSSQVKIMICQQTGKATCASETKICIRRMTSYRVQVPIAGYTIMKIISATTASISIATPKACAASISIRT